MKKYAKVVFIDQTELDTLPDDLKKVMVAAGAGIPLVAFLSPDGATDFGSFNHGTLKNQDYTKIFKEVKTKIKDAQKEGTLKGSGVVAKDEDKDTKETDAVVIVSPQLRKWKSTKGSEIEAKLIKFEDDTYHLLTSKGKNIKVTASDLDPESVKMAEEIVRVSKK